MMILKPNIYNRNGTAIIPFLSILQKRKPTTFNNKQKKKVKIKKQQQNEKSNKKMKNQIKKKIIVKPSTFEPSSRIRNK